jgi:hypothetical protein
MSPRKKKKNKEEVNYESLIQKMIEIFVNKPKEKKT